MKRRIVISASLLLVLLAAVWFGDQRLRPEPEPDLGRDALIELANSVISNDIGARNTALADIRARAKLDMVAGLILALRYVRDIDDEISSTLSFMTGDNPGADWKSWMQWQELHPEIEPFDGFEQLKADVLATLDPGYRVFVRAGMAREIRIEEIVWGGVRAGADGIPALNHPERIAAHEADYMMAEDMVFGISIAGDARAYPLRIMNWHEMFNDRVGGVDLALAYCTLCGSGILYETRLEGADKPILFGSSGLLYRSNKLMYDDETKSLWNQFTGRPVAGPLTGSGIVLKTRPVVITTWEKWLAGHPDTTVLSLATGHPRDYSPGAVYGEYFASPELMFPAALRERSLEAKDYVFGLTVQGAEKAWPLSAFEGGAVINDDAGGKSVVLIGDAATRSVRAYDGGGLQFSALSGRDDALTAAGEIWEIGEEALSGPGGRRLQRLAGHIAFWFAWTGFREQTPLYQPQ